MDNLYVWQKKCLETWLENNGLGIVSAVTGSGKTLLAIGAISALADKLPPDKTNKLKIKIIIPRLFLIWQWMESLHTVLQIPTEEIGVYSGSRKDTTRKYMIYVINSARESFAKHVREDFASGCPVLLIADECHHYASSENCRIFDFLYDDEEKSAQANYYALGLSATPQTANFTDRLVPALGPQIFQYGFNEALNAQIISSFAIFNIKLHFTPDEEAKYEDLSIKITRILSILLNKFKYLNKLKRIAFFAALENIIRTGNMKESSLATSLLNLANRRKRIIYAAESRIHCIKDLLEKIPTSAKVIIFNERIKMTDVLYEELRYLYPGQVGRYHSKIPQETRGKMLEQYNQGQIRIMVACRSLDEGLNVPATDIGIVAATTASSRQRIQRLGRILRTTELKNTAILYYLYIGSTNEEPDFLADISYQTNDQIPIIDLDYDETKHAFYQPVYQSLVDKIMVHAARKKWHANIINEISKNLELGAISCDWWLSERDCQAKYQAAENKVQRNYWLSMLLVVRANLNRLR